MPLAICYLLCTPAHTHTPPRTQNPCSMAIPFHNFWYAYLYALCVYRFYLHLSGVCVRMYMCVFLGVNANANGKCEIKVRPTWNSSAQRCICWFIRTHTHIQIYIDTWEHAYIYIEIYKHESIWHIKLYLSQQIMQISVSEQIYVMYVCMYVCVCVCVKQTQKVWALKVSRSSWHTRKLVCHVIIYVLRNWYSVWQHMYLHMYICHLYAERVAAC